MHFTDTHEWINLDGDIGTVGITDYAQKELGDIVYIELPTIGAAVKASQEAVALESTKAAADVYSPVSGTIVEVNNKLAEQTELVNNAPEGEGWLFKVKLKDLQELNALMDTSTYHNKFKK